MANKMLKRHLQFQVRRGMLELDIFLSRFLNERFDDLAESDQQLFCELLKENDQDLFVWLTGREKSNNPTLQKMIDAIRENTIAQS